VTALADLVAAVRFTRVVDGGDLRFVTIRATCEPCGKRVEHTLDPIGMRAVGAAEASVRDQLRRVLDEDGCDHAMPGAILRRLAAAVKRGTVMAWVMRYAPAGDAVVRREWDRAPDGETLGQLIWAVGTRRLWIGDAVSDRT
jgi:hypothetical protein